MGVRMFYEYKNGGPCASKGYLMGWVDAWTILCGLEIIEWVFWQDWFGTIVCVFRMLVWCCAFTKYMIYIDNG